MNTLKQDMKLWNTGQIDIHEIERRLEQHGLTEQEILELLPDLVIMKSLFPETGKP